MYYKKQPVQNLSNTNTKVQPIAKIIEIIPNEEQQHRICNWEQYIKNSQFSH